MKVPQTVPEAFTEDNLVELVEANEFGPEIDSEMADRLAELAKQRTQSRSTDSMHVGEKDFLVMTTWDSYCRDTFGSCGVGDNNVPNRFTLGVPNFQVSSGSDAWLIENAVAVQQGWLEDGDGRRSQIEEVDQTDTSFHDERGEFWSPKEYTAIIGFGDEMVYEDPSLVDAM